MKSLKILFILDYFIPNKGGAETLFWNLCKKLSDDGHIVTVLTSRHSKNLAKKEKIKDNLIIHRTGTNRKNFILFCLFKGLGLAKKCDIIHTTTHTALIPAKILSKIYKKKIIVTVHEVFGKLWYEIKGRNGFFYKLFEKISLKLNFDKYICPSKNTQNDLISKIGIPKEKTHMIYNGIDYNFWNKNNFNKDKVRYRYNLEDSFVGLFYGRCDKLKGLEYFVEAIPEILIKIPNFKAIIIANGKDSNKIHFKNIILLKDIDEKIIWIDGVEYNRLGDFILAADFVIVPSISEGFGFVAAETCALKQDIVVSKTASLPEIVNGKVNFFEKGNVQDLVCNVIDTYQGNFKIIPDKKFPIEENMKMHEEVYEEILTNH